MNVRFETATSREPVHRSARFERRYSRSDVILYALSVGVGMREPLEVEEIKYVFEPRLIVLPTFAATLAAHGTMSDGVRGADRLTGALHMGQWLRVHGMLHPEGTVSIQTKIEEKSAGSVRGRSLVCVSNELSDADSGNLIAVTTSMLMVSSERGECAAERPARLQPSPSLPRPDGILELPTAPNQALMYRLTGDCNPLHIDPRAASAAGFPAPILHGLASYGMVGRALIKKLCGDNPRHMRELRMQFTDVVFPGEPLCLQMWDVATGKATFRVVASRREHVVIDLGMFKYDE